MRDWKNWRKELFSDGWFLILIGIPVFLEAALESTGTTPSLFDISGFTMGAAWGFLVYVIAKKTEAPVAKRLAKLRANWLILLLFALLFPLIPFILEVLLQG